MGDRDQRREHSKLDEDAARRSGHEVDQGAENSKRVVARFDAVAGRYAGYYTGPSAAGEALCLRRERVLAQFDRPDGVVLDVGCGPGVLVEPLRALGCRLWSVDLSHGMLTEAVARHGVAADRAFAQARAERLPFRDESFDAVLSMGVVEYTDAPRSLAEMARVLRPGGTLLVTLPNRRSPYTVWKTYVYYPLAGLARGAYRRLMGKPRLPFIHDAKRMFTPRELRSLFPTNLTIESVVPSTFKVLPSPLDALLPWLDIALMRLLEGSGRGALRSFGTAIIVRVRKCAD